MLLFIRAIALFISLLTVLQAQTPADSGWAALLDTNYRYEVAGYCGLVTGQVHQSFKAEAQLLSEQYNISKERQLEASGKGWQAAHKEWLNRGLGGFKRWCRNEGQTYAAGFLKPDINSE